MRNKLMVSMLNGYLASSVFYKRTVNECQDIGPLRKLAIDGDRYSFIICWQDEEYNKSLGAIIKAHGQELYPIMRASNPVAFELYSDGLISALELFQRCL